MNPKRSSKILDQGSRIPSVCHVQALALQVFESAPEYRPQGAGVLVNLNGQNALEAIDPQLYERYSRLLCYQ